jgi:hypothetical protein
MVESARKIILWFNYRAVTSDRGNSPCKKGVLVTCDKCGNEAIFQINFISKQKYTDFFSSSSDAHEILKYNIAIDNHGIMFAGAGVLSLSAISQPCFAQKKKCRRMNRLC